jgi:hypothetical protein
MSSCARWVWRGSARARCHALCSEIAAGFISCAMPSHADKRQRRIVAAWIGTAFAEADAETARAQWRRDPDRVRTWMPKLAIPMDDAEAGYGFEWIVSM